MKTSHIKQRNKRLAKRHSMRSTMLGLIVGLAVATTVFTVLGWMDWSDIEPTTTTAPIVVESEITTSGLAVK